MRKFGVSLFRRHTPTEKPPTSEAAAESSYSRHDFIGLCQQALQLFLPQKLTNFTLADLVVFLKRLDPKFHPMKYGSPDLRSLVQECRFIGFARGRYHIVRDSNRPREPIITDNATWSYVEPLSPQRMHAIHGPNSPFGDSRPVKPKRRDSYTALSLKLAKMTQKRPKPRRNHQWSNDSSFHEEGTMSGIEKSMGQSPRMGFGQNYNPAPDFSNQEFFRDR
ncbi:O-acetyltransferase-like protein [Perkinsela sp. CCAP 1560/4]|nr:O-acetyltransferase-like protein [Perkinsela sp. CCAP 1560/4]|eukprot:KNH04228.1 O-acetyltransferase-like protein [Perkinsela sp. CCAP 1560/4]